MSGIGSPLSPSLTNSLNSYLLRKLISISYLPRGTVKCTYVEGGFPRQGIVVIQVINGYNNVTIILSFGSDRMSAIPGCPIQLTLPYFCHSLPGFKSSSKSNGIGNGIYDPI